MNFSHIYIEEDILDHPRTKEILSLFPKSIKISIHNYKNIFNPSNQNFQAQKLKPKLILAKKKDHFFYKGSPLTDTFNRGPFYYNSLIMNCIYNCEYCYLQGMYNSSHIVIFINLEDFFNATSELLRIENKVTLCISYDTDLLAMERIIPYTSKWIEFAESNRNLSLEIRTKSSFFNRISHLKPIENVVLAWTLSPESIVKKFEFNTATLQRRLQALSSAIQSGWKTRICLDPILHVKNWKDIYKSLISQIFSYPSISEINEITFGVFRINSDYLKKMKKMRNDSEIIYYPYKKFGSIETYKKEIEIKIKNFIYHELCLYISKEKIYY